MTLFYGLGSALFLLFASMYVFVDQWPKATYCAIVAVVLALWEIERKLR